MKCPDCGNSEMRSVRRDHAYTESGLPGIVLLNLEFRVCPKCKEEEMVIPRLAQLHRLIATRVAEKEPRLTGAEIRFLRKHLGWSQPDFAATMGVTETTVSRWENEREPMGAVAERLLRLMALRDRPMSDYPNERLADVAKTDAQAVHLRLEPIQSGWRESVAA